MVSIAYGLIFVFLITRYALILIDIDWFCKIKFKLYTFFKHRAFWKIYKRMSCRGYIVSWEEALPSAGCRRFSLYQNIPLPLPLLTHSPELWGLQYVSLPLPSTPFILQKLYLWDSLVCPHWSILQYRVCQQKPDAQNFNSKETF